MGRLRTSGTNVAHVIRALVLLALCFSTAAVFGELVAFPGAEGEGRLTSGGRGGDVYHVTNLNDSGAGSLRYGLDTAFNGPRTIVFDVGGTIALNSGLSVRNANVTIAGETAPGYGVEITQYGLSVDAPNVIMRHMRVRPGDARKGSSAQNGFNGDAISINRSDVILDHVSASWGIDENLSVAGNGTRRVTVQWSTISEGLDQTGLYHGEWNADYNPGGPEGHSMGSLIKPGDGNGIVSFHHNLWSNNGNRNPAIGNYSNDHNMKADIRNNVLFNNRSNGYSSGESERIDMNYVGNYIIAGFDTKSSSLWRAFEANAANNMRIYQSGNLIDGEVNIRLTGFSLGWDMFTGAYQKLVSPVAMAPVETHSAEEAYERVLASAGAFPRYRDAVDARLVNQVRTFNGKIIDSQSEVGGYPTLPTVVRPSEWDTDGDGMPDHWEAMIEGLNPLVADNNGDVDGNGYTNLEDYLHYAAMLAVPEPSTIVLLGAAMVVLLARSSWRRLRRS